MMFKKMGILAVLLISFKSAAAQSSLEATPSSSTWSGLQPQSIMAQHAGYAGFAAAGVGYASDSERFGLDLMYGFTPALYAGQNVHSMSVKGTWTMASVDLGNAYRWRPYLGLNILYSPHKDLFVVLPEQYPDSYYVPSAIRPAMLLGWAFRWQQQSELGIEYALLDSEISYYKDTKRFDTQEIGSFGLTARWLLD